MVTLYGKNTEVGVNGWASDLVLDTEQSLTQKQINAYLYPKIKRENVSVWDFFTKAEINSYKADFTKFDASRPLQEFFNYIAANNVGTAYCNGVFYTTKGIVFGGESGSNTKQVVGDFHLCAITGSVIHTLFLMQCGKELTWLGSIHVQGLGGLIFSTLPST